MEFNFSRSFSVSCKFHIYFPIFEKGIKAGSKYTSVPYVRSALTLRWECMQSLSCRRCFVSWLRTWSEAGVNTNKSCFMILECIATRLAQIWFCIVLVIFHTTECHHTVGGVIKARLLHWCHFLVAPISGGQQGMPGAWYMASHTQVSQRRFTRLMLQKN